MAPACCICGGEAHRVIEIRRAEGNRLIRAAAYCETHWHALRRLLGELDNRLGKQAARGVPYEHGLPT